MGLLSLGEPLNQEETLKYSEHVRRHGIRQFISIYNKNKDRIDRCFKWGDEIEYMIVRFDDNNRKVRLSLTSEEVLKGIRTRMKTANENYNRQVLWISEFGAYQLEGTPAEPYGNKDHLGHGSMSHLFSEVEANMNIRRRDIKDILGEDQKLLCISNFPRLGCDDTTHPFTKADPFNGITNSRFVSIDCIYRGHPRYLYTDVNTRLRRGGHVVINVPIFKDTNTPEPFVERLEEPMVDNLAQLDHIYMDDVVLGMGCSCLQAINVDEAMLLYDQMTSFTPIFMALSAATPILRGYLSDLDCRWSLISQAIDDRTDEERGEKPLKNNKFRIHKSRYDSIDSYLCESNRKYNDIPLVYDKQYYDEMMSAGVPDQLARHIAHLFIRDSVVIYRELLDQNDEIDSDHFENIQSTNWQSLRFKPPSASQPSIGWRVEFRTMEIQSTDFENSAFVVVIILITRIILHFRLNFLIPISKVDENMIEAQKRDAVNTGRFWFRKHVLNNNYITPEKQQCNGCEDVNDSYELMSIDEIINGKGDTYSGLLPFVRQYLDTIKLDIETRNRIDKYIQLISWRASGELQTTAQWMRDFVRKHNDYKFDSVVNESICYDLIHKLSRFQDNQIVIKQLVGNLL